MTGRTPVPDAPATAPSGSAAATNPRSSGETLLEVRRLTAAYNGEDGRFVAASEVSFTLRKGETLCIVGESSCGKSTVAMAVPRLLPEPPAEISAESIRILGQEFAGAPREKFRPLRGGRMGVIFQEPMTALSPLHRIGRQIEETVLLHRPVGRRAAADLALEWLARVGIADPPRAALAYPHELSGGMQQRVMIAMALVNEPDIVIADEPTTALDATTQAQVLALVAELTGKSSGLLLITHDMGVVRAMASRVAVMYAGRIVETAACADLFARPRHPYTQALLSSMPSLATRGRRLPVIEGFVPTLAESAAMTGCRFKPRCPYRAICGGGDAECVFDDSAGPHTCCCEKVRLANGGAA